MQLNNLKKSSQMSIKLLLILIYFVQPKNSDLHKFCNKNILLKKFNAFEVLTYVLHIIRTALYKINIIIRHYPWTNVFSYLTCALDNMLFLLYRTFLDVFSSLENSFLIITSLIISQSIWHSMNILNEYYILNSNQYRHYVYIHYVSSSCVLCFIKTLYDEPIPIVQHHISSRHISHNRFALFDVCSFALFYF